MMRAVPIALLCVGALAEENSGHGHNGHGHNDSPDAMSWPMGAPDGPVCIQKNSLTNYPLYKTAMLANMASPQGASHPMTFGSYTAHMPNMASDMMMGSTSPCPAGTTDATAMFFPSSSPPPASIPTADEPCFAAETTTACKLLDASASADAAYAACYEGASGSVAQRVLMAHLAPLDQVLTSTAEGLALTRVLVVQHVAESLAAKILTLHTPAGSLSLTPEHGLYIDGAIARVADAKAGATLTRADGAAETITRVSQAEATPVINAVTAAGTILAADHAGTPLLAASHPHWAAALFLKHPALHALANAALYVVGDVTSAGRFAAVLVGKAAASLAVAAVATKALARAAAAK